MVRDLAVKVIWTALLLAMCALMPGSGQAGLVAEAPTCEQACVDAVGGFVERYLKEHAPVLAAAPASFEDAALGDAKACPARPQQGPAVFGVMLGPGMVEGFTALTGPANDIRLMNDVMRQRVVAPGFISAAADTQADRPGMLAAMAKALTCLRERDQLVLVYSGWGTVYPLEWLDPNDVMKELCAKGEAQEICAAGSTPLALSARHRIGTSLRGPRRS